MRLQLLALSKNGVRVIPSMFNIQAPRYSTASEKVCEDEVIFETVGGGRAVINLNRPKQLNTLNTSMVKQIREKMLKWKDEKYLIVIKGAGEKAFCAGGDVVAVTKDKSGKTATEFFGEEYKLDALISSLKIPVASFISGIVMGGGVGISLFGKIRVATETSMFAMPETQIGFFPDVGVSYHLARMPNNLGEFLALTGYRLKGYDLVHAGIATHFCTVEKLRELEDALLRNFSKSCSESPEDIFKEFHEASVKTFRDGPPAFTLASHKSTLTSWFSGRTLEDVMSKISSDKSAFATETEQNLKKMSPLSLKVTFKQIRDAAKMDIYQCFNADYRIALKMLRDGDFTEGVRALLIDKDKKPKWKHADIKNVKDEEVNKFFAAVDSQEELNLPDSLHEASR